MADALKRDIALKFLTPMVVAYAGLAAALGPRAPFGIEQFPFHIAATAGVAGLIGLVLEELFPRALKETIVFWRRSERVPGFRAFSAIAPMDHRVDPQKLAALLPTAPMTSAQQNSCWYGWLKEVEGDAGVAQNHRNALVLRDAAVLAAVLCIVTPIWALFTLENWRQAAVLEFICLLAYSVLMISARHSSDRLVANVIAIKVAKSP